MSDAIHTGRNRDLGTYRDDAQVRCSHCGFVCNRDRDTRGAPGSRQGSGLKQPFTQLNGVVDEGSTTINVDSTAGFPTPAAGETLYIYIYETRPE